MVDMKEKDRAPLAERFDDSDPLRVVLITMSDRASKGEYEDKSGRRLLHHVETLFGVSGISTVIETKLFPDDRDTLRKEMENAKNGGAHLVITTGGTGVAPRDITTDVVLELADKTIPGVMEAIRMKFAIDKPCALLSRTVAAVLGGALVYTLPGSTKGVDEYMGEIVKSMPHTLCVLHGLDVH